MLTVPKLGVSVAVMCNLQGASLRELTQTLAATVLPHQDAVTDYSPAMAKLRAAVRYEVEQKDLPAFSIALVDEDQIVWSDGFGFQDARKTIPATAESIYRVGSVSKLFTDITVMQLVEQGKLDLDAPVQKYLPDFKPSNPYDKLVTAATV